MADDIAIEPGKLNRVLVLKNLEFVTTN